MPAIAGTHLSYMCLRVKGNQKRFQSTVFDFTSESNHLFRDSNCDGGNMSYSERFCIHEGFSKESNTILILAVYSWYPATITCLAQDCKCSNSWRKMFLNHNACPLGPKCEIPQCNLESGEWILTEHKITSRNFMAGIVLSNLSINHEKWMINWLKKISILVNVDASAGGAQLTSFPQASCPLRKEFFGCESCGEVFECVVKSLWMCVHLLAPLRTGWICRIWHYQASLLMASKFESTVP